MTPQEMKAVALDAVNSSGDDLGTVPKEHLKLVTAMASDGDTAARKALADAVGRESPTAVASSGKARTGAAAAAAVRSARLAGTREQLRVQTKARATAAKKAEDARVVADKPARDAARANMVKAVEDLNAAVTDGAKARAAAAAAKAAKVAPRVAPRPPVQDRVFR